MGLPAAAERLGLHRATVNEMVQQGRLPGQRVGAHWYIRSDDLDEFAIHYERPRNAPRRIPKPVQPSLQILELLDDWTEATVAELHAVVDLHEGNIRKQLCIAEAQGLARRDEYSRWSLTEAGRQGIAQKV